MKRALYTGLELPRDMQGKSVDHCSLIEIRPRPIDDPFIDRVLGQLGCYTHLIFTSKTAVDIFFSYAKQRNKEIGARIAIAVGTSTARAISSRTDLKVIVAQKETAEGVVEVLSGQDLAHAQILWPHSTLSRKHITDHLSSRGITFDACVFYETHTRRPEILPNLDDYDEIIFTSPSTVVGFIELYGALPLDKILTSIGPVTREALVRFQMLMIK